MLLYISITNFILAILLSIYNWHRNKTATYLTLFLLSISVYGLAHYFTVYGNDQFWLAIFYNHFTPLNLIAGPFLYFYVRGTLTDKQGISRADLLHFTPAFIHFAGILPYLLSPFDYKLQVAQSIIQDLNNLHIIKSNIIFNVSSAFFIRPTLLLIYTGYCVYLLWKYRLSSKNTDNIPSKQFRITYRWLSLLLLNVCLMSANFLYLTMVFINTNAKEIISNSNVVYYAIGILFGLMALALLFFPQVLYGMPNYRQVESNSTLSKQTEQEKTPSKVQEITKTSEIQDKDNEPFLELAKRIEEYSEKNKPYTDPEFSIEHLAKGLNVPLNHVSYCLSNVMNTKFTTYRMKLRIDYAKELLKAGKNEEYTIEGIAQQSGFSTRSNFYNAFKNETGFTPTDFIKLEQDQ